MINSTIADKTRISYELKEHLKNAEEKVMKFNQKSKLTIKIFNKLQSSD